MRQAWRAAMASTFLLAALVTCATRPEPTTAPATGSTTEPTIGRPPPADVKAMLAWLAERTMSCTEVPGAEGQRRWSCAGASVWSADLADSLTVAIDGDDQRATRITATLDATQTVGHEHELCPNTDCDARIGFFADTIALSPLTRSSGGIIGRWVESRRQSGGMGEFNGFVISFDAALPLMSMTVEIPGAG